MKEIRILCIFFLAGLKTFSQNLDSLKTLVAGNISDTAKLQTLVLITELCEESEIPKYALPAVNLADKLLADENYSNFKKNIWHLKGSAYNNLGFELKRRGDYPKAIEYYEKAIENHQLAGYKSGMATDYNNIGNIYQLQGNIGAALKNFSRSLKLAEELDEKESIAIALVNIAYVNKVMKNYEQALKYLERCIEIWQESENKTGLANGYNAIGVIYGNMKKYSLDFKYTTRAIELYKSIGDKSGLATSLVNLATLYWSSGDPDCVGGNAEVCSRQSVKKALALLNESLVLYSDLGDVKGRAHVYNSLSEVYLGEKDLKMAKIYGDSSLAISKRIGSIEILESSSLVMTKIFDAIGEHKKALDFYRLHIVYRDSMQNRENLRKTLESQMQYEFEKKEVADSLKNASLLEKETMKHEQEIHKQKIYTYGGIVGFVLMLLIAGISLNAYRLKQRANNAISKQKMLVEEKQKAILDSINYARRIQQSLLPSESLMNRLIEKMRRRS